jgi:prepilin-type processing-associated H-X9-DG protein
MQGDANWAGDPYTGYNYNTSYLGGPTEPLGGWELAGGMPPTARIDDIGTPGECVVFGDGSYGEGANKFMRSPWEGPRDTDIPPEGPTRGAGCQGFLHLGTTNASFADGHAQWFETAYRETYPEAKTWISKIGGFLSPDNSLYDLK